MPSDCQLWDGGGNMARAASAAAVNQGVNGYGGQTLYYNGFPRFSVVCYTLDGATHNPGTQINGLWSQGQNYYAERLFWNPDDSYTLQLQRLQQAVPVGYVFDANSVNIGVPTVIAVNSVTHQAAVSRTASARALFDWSNTATLAQSIAGLSVADATARLNATTGVTGGTVSISVTGGTGSLPQNAGNITFIVNNP